MHPCALPTVLGLAAALTAQSTPVQLDASSSPSATQFRTARVGVAVYAVWVDDRNGLTDVYFNRSLDGGLTWMPSDTRINHDAAGAATVHSVSIAAFDDFVHVAWVDERNRDSQVFWNRSDDRGLTWQATDTRLDRGPRGTDSGSVEITATSSSVTALWVDARNGIGELFSNSSFDNGATWMANDMNLSLPTVPNRSNISNLVVTAVGAHVHAAWIAGFGAIQYTRSTDGGSTWQPTSEPSAGAVSVKLRACGTHVYISWNASGSVILLVSPDDGATWNPTQLIHPGPIPLGSSVIGATHDIACDGSNVYVTWDIPVFLIPPSSSVWFRHSGDHGTTFGPPVRFGASRPLPFQPSVAAVDGTVGVTYLSVGAPTGPFMNYSTDHGATWLPTDATIDSSPTPGPVRLSVDDGTASLVWQPDAPGPSHLRAAVGFASTSIGGGCGTVPAPSCPAPPSASLGFSLTPAPIPACASTPLFLIGSGSPNPISVPAGVGCGSCDLLVTTVWGSFASPMTVGAGLLPGFEFVVQSVCATTSGCAEVSAGARIVVGP